MSKKILVTGGAGFLGAALVKRLVQENHSVRVLDNGFRGSSKRLTDLKDHIETISADIRDAEAVHQAIEGMDTVIHLAAVNGTEFFYSNPALVLDVGVRGILNVLDGCLKGGVGDLLVASSSEVYQTPPTIPTNEKVPLMIPDVTNPRYSYGGSKILTELLVTHYAHVHFQRALLFRPHNVYGPDMGYEHVIPQFIIKIADAMDRTPFGPLPFPLQGNGRQTRSFIHIKEMIDGMTLLLERGEQGEIYHIGNPEEVKILDVARKIALYLGREIEPQETALQPGSTERRCPDISKMEALGFSPSLSLDEGLPAVIEWYKKNRRKS